jgi:hypothetical protein
VPLAKVGREHILAEVAARAAQYRVRVIAVSGRGVVLNEQVVGLHTVVMPRDDGGRRAAGPSALSSSRARSSSGASGRDIPAGPRR